ncbi:hypothetical protein PV327_008429 [Microctonus hyperodae]|uniref:Uncharacterized protein n=1 Tax=Microctonus hyperodae TaxID=165561 RepID=A0AA39F368_MICHY|nr:hypothetical protein PV327_008429 [Microctonus hyperodae]
MLGVSLKKQQQLDMSWQYKLHHNGRTLVCLTTKSAATSSVQTTIIKERRRPAWLHLIAIFFSKKMLYAAAQYSFAAGVMIHYHARLGFHLLLLAACMDYV